MPDDIKKLETLLGAPFPRRQLLLEAVTHRSYATEHNLGYDNQRLEFLGDAVLEIILTDYLFKRYPEAAEGEMTVMRSALVREASLAKLARGIKLGRYLHIGRGEEGNAGSERDSTLADLFEAVLGAFYLNAGFDAVRSFLLTLIEAEFPDPHSLSAALNPKGDLQELSQNKWGEQPQYVVTHVSGPEHHPTYEVEVRLHGLVALGRASSRRAAESEAAQQLLNHLHNGKGAI